MLMNHILMFGFAPAQHFALGGDRWMRRSYPLGLGRLLIDAADAKLAARDSHFLQFLEYLIRHALRQVDEAMILANIHAPDVHALDPGLVGDGADDVAGLIPCADPTSMRKVSIWLRRIWVAACGPARHPR